MRCSWAAELDGTECPIRSDTERQFWRASEGLLVAEAQRAGGCADRPEHAHRPLARI